MNPRRRLSTVLLESERVTPEDVERGLEHQRTHGGYLGEALVELGIVRREEIEWALASQLDLPFIFPDPEAVDPEVAGVVPADWALAHVAVPILRAGDVITVVVADPLDRETVDEVRARTGLEVQMALATPDRIRELIRVVYGRPEAAGESDVGGAMAVGDLVAEALARGADRIGVSARGAQVLGWWSVGEAVERHRLKGGWDDALATLVHPSPFGTAAATGDGAGATSSTVRHGGVEVPVDVRLLEGVSGLELLIRPRRRAPARSAARGVPTGVLADLRLLAGTRQARVGVAGERGPVEEVLSRLPGLVLGSAARWAHIAHAADVPGLYTLRPDVPGFPELLASLAFDAITVDLPLDRPDLPSILAAAPLALAAVPPDSTPDAAGRAGIRWLLELSAGVGDPGGDEVAGDGDAGEWTLRPVER